ncbi:hypothetical protein G6L37_07585 [Agrobacterium rubi]|nr:hypothetical protein [Agrobacterium rubi]NTF25230.1 hypothetical protein [Agrobacterium rubi]
MTEIAPSLGPVFYAIRVAKRSDNVTVYFGETLGADRKYKRERLNEAALYIDRERAEIHLDGSLEIGPEVVTLFAVRELGDWRGWHVTMNADVKTLNGPDGHLVTKNPRPAGRGAAKFPWNAHWPEEKPLKDHHGRIRHFATAMSARKAIERAMRDEHQRHVGEANLRSSGIRQ